MARTETPRPKNFEVWFTGDADMFYQTFFGHELEAARWQREELLHLSGFADPYDDNSLVEPTKENPLLYTLRASNGSGKDQVVIKTWALWSIMSKIQYHWIGTSSSYVQLNEQTWRHIKAGAAAINNWFGVDVLEIMKFKIRCPRTGSEITLFRTDEDSKTEGWHPLVKDGGMAILLNECKSLDPELVIAFKRCHGYTHWVNVSSPGDPVGYFYDRCTSPVVEHWPKPVKLGTWYHRRINHNQCPWLLAEYRRDVEEFGVEHPFIQSSYHAEFVIQDKLFVVSLDRWNYPYPVRDDFGMPKRAGVDLSLGGDATVISIWQGNHFLKEIEIHERHEPTLTRLIVDLLKQEQVPAAQTYADAGSMGAAIIQRMGEEGYPVNAILNQQSPKNGKLYKNRGAELAMNYRRLIVDQVLNLSGTSEKLRRQSAARLYMYKDGKIQLEDKATFRGRVGYSPDHFDAAVLAQAGMLPTVLKSAKPSAPKTRDYRDELREIYGELDNRAANSGAYRTSGTYARRIGKPVHEFNRHLGF